MRTYPPDVRVDAIYISDVDLDQNKSTIQEAVLSDILTVFPITLISFIFTATIFHVVLSCRFPFLFLSKFLF